MTRGRTTTQAGLGWEHQQRRAQLLPLWLGRPCPIRWDNRCDGIMTDPARMDLDHTRARALGGQQLGDRMACRHCNRAAGAALGNRLRGRRRAQRGANRVTPYTAQPLRTSRSW